MIWLEILVTQTLVVEYYLNTGRMASSGVVTKMMKCTFGELQRRSELTDNIYVLVPWDNKTILREVT